MANRFTKFTATASMAAMLATGMLSSVPKPASADTTSTLLTAAAAIGGLILFGNYEHQRQQADMVVGYTENGGTVYGDGRVVMPNGRIFYPNANGQYPGGQYAYYSRYANAGAYQYDYQRTGEYDRTGRHRNNGNGWNGNGNNNASWHRNNNNNNANNGNANSNRDNNEGGSQNDQRDRDNH